MPFHAMASVKFRPFPNFLWRIDRQIEHSLLCKLTETSAFWHGRVAIRFNRVCVDRSSIFSTGCVPSFFVMTKILIVDDEPTIVELAQLYLQQEGFEISSAADGVEALVQVRRERPDLLILDLMLPELDGWEVCKRLRAETNIPVIMLTARSDDVDKIVGLELGADDYVTKPFNPRELVARVKAVLRRVQGNDSQADGSVFGFGDVIIDVARRLVTVDGTPVVLRTKEFDLLLTLARHPGIVLSREQLLDQVWGYDYVGGTRTVDVHVSGLRQKLSGSRVHIETVWGIGYKLVIDAND